MQVLAIIYLVLTILFLLTRAADQENVSMYISLTSWCVAIALAIVVIAS